MIPDWLWLTREQLVRPTYGDFWEVRPRRWWWPPDRRKAKIASKIVSRMDVDEAGYAAAVRAFVAAGRL